MTSFCRGFPTNYSFNFLFIPRMQHNPPIFSSFILRTKDLSIICPCQRALFPEPVSCSTKTSSLYSACVRLSCLKFLIVFSVISDKFRNITSCWAATHSFHISLIFCFLIMLSNRQTQTALLN